ncbi:NfeD family protein [Paenibacillus catalpae]|uniref:NfeD family protein n=1 Tax=Paenibacillus catalpae TaxID=1045775 RepID=UPI003183AB4E
MELEAIFWGCFVGGALYAMISALLGDLIGHALGGVLDFLSLDGHPWLNPTTLVGGLTAFGGAGLLLAHYTALGFVVVLVLAVCSGVLVGGGGYFLYVKPMSQSENSIALSEKDLSGKIAEVITAIPSKGYGEVLVKAGAGHTNQIAASFDGEDIPGGVRVVIVEVKDNTLYVSKLDPY